MPLTEAETGVILSVLQENSPYPEELLRRIQRGIAALPNNNGDAIDPEQLDRIVREFADSRGYEELPGGIASTVAEERARYIEQNRNYEAQVAQAEVYMDVFRQGAAMNTPSAPGGSPVRGSLLIRPLLSSVMGMTPDEIDAVTSIEDESRIAFGPAAYVGRFPERVDLPVLSLGEAQRASLEAVMNFRGITDLREATDDFIQNDDYVAPGEVVGINDYWLNGEVHYPFDERAEAARVADIISSAAPSTRRAGLTYVHGAEGNIREGEIRIPYRIRSVNAVIPEGAVTFGVSRTPNVSEAARAAGHESRVRAFGPDSPGVMVPNRDMAMVRPATEVGDALRAEVERIYGPVEERLQAHHRRQFMTEEEIQAERQAIRGRQRVEDQARGASAPQPIAIAGRIWSDETPRLMTDQERQEDQARGRMGPRLRGRPAHLVVLDEAQEPQFADYEARGRLRGVSSAMDRAFSDQQVMGEQAERFARQATQELVRQRLMGQTPLRPDGTPMSLAETVTHLRQIREGSQGTTLAFTAREFQDRYGREDVVPDPDQPEPSPAEVARAVAEIEELHRMHRGELAFENSRPYPEGPVLPNTPESTFSNISPEQFTDNALDEEDLRDADEQEYRNHLRRTREITAEDVAEDDVSGMDDFLRQSTAEAEALRARHPPVPEIGDELLRMYNEADPVISPPDINTGPDLLHMVAAIHSGLGLPRLNANFEEFVTDLESAGRGFPEVVREVHPTTLGEVHSRTPEPDDLGDPFMVHSPVSHGEPGILRGDLFVVAGDTTPPAIPTLDEARIQAARRDLLEMLGNILMNQPVFNYLARFQNAREAAGARGRELLSSLVERIERACVDHSNGRAILAAMFESRMLLTQLQGPMTALPQESAADRALDSLLNTSSDSAHLNTMIQSGLGVAASHPDDVFRREFAAQFPEQEGQVFSREVVNRALSTVSAPERGVQPGDLFIVTSGTTAERLPDHLNPAREPSSNEWANIGRAQTDLMEMASEVYAGRQVFNMPRRFQVAREAVGPRGSLMERHLLEHSQAIMRAASSQGRRDILDSMYAAGLNPNQLQGGRRPQARPPLVSVLPPLSHGEFSLGAAGKEVLRFDAKGQIFVQGRLVTTDLEIVKGLRRFLHAGGFLHDPEIRSEEQMAPGSRFDREDPV